MAKRKRMSEDELASKVDSQIADAQLYGETDRDKAREWALKFFDGETDLPSMGEHRSKVVSRDVSDIHGLIMPSLLRVFFGSDRIVSYEPTRTEHEEYADQASDLVNYIVMKECDGYRNFRSAISDGLLLGNGIVKHWWDETPEYTTDTYTALTEDQYRMVLQEPDVEEILEHETYADPDWVAPPPPPPELIMSALLGGVPMATGMMPGGAPIAPIAPIATMMPPIDLMAEAMEPEDDDRQTGETKDTSDDDADPMAPRLHDFKVKRIRSNGRLRIASVPHEEFIIERRATVLDETVRFCAHVRRTTRSELIKEGYERDKVDAIPLSTDMERDLSRRARDRTFEDADVAPDQSTQLVDVYECYVLVDSDGDGIAERRRIVMGGLAGKRSILANDEWGDDIPFSDLVPNPRAHAWRGKGLYEELGDIQRIKTVVLRGVLDNTYQQIAPQRWVDPTQVLNIDEVVNPTPDGVVFTKTGGVPPQPVQAPVVFDKLLPILEVMDSIGEKRTGASQRTSALDMDALQNQSATAVNVVQAAVQTKNEEYARNIAECGGMQRVFGCILRLITKHQDRSKMVRLHGKLVEIDPRSWNADMNVTINIGLGTGSRDRDLAALSAVSGKQEQLIGQFGPFNEEMNVGHLVETYQKMAEAAGIRNPEAFFPSISQDRVKQLRDQMQQANSQPKPDPKVLEAQAKLQIRREEMQFEQQGDVARFQLEQEMAERKEQREAEQEQARIIADASQRVREAELKLELQREESAARIRLLERETEARLEIARTEATMKQEARYREMDIESQLSQIAMALKVNLNTANIARPE